MRSRATWFRCCFLLSPPLAPKIFSVDSMKPCAPVKDCRIADAMDTRSCGRQGCVFMSSQSCSRCRTLGRCDAASRRRRSVRSSTGLRRAASSRSDPERLSVSPSKRPQSVSAKRATGASSLLAIVMLPLESTETFSASAAARSP